MQLHYLFLENLYSSKETAVTKNFKLFSTFFQFSLTSKNPVLKNITDFLVEEGSFEEEELLGMVKILLDRLKQGVGVNQNLNRINTGFYSTWGILYMGAALRFSVSMDLSLRLMKFCLPFHAI